MADTYVFLKLLGWSDENIKSFIFIYSPLIILFIIFIVFLISLVKKDHVDVKDHERIKKEYLKDKLKK